MIESRHCDARPLTFRTLLNDPLTRLVMDSDNVSLQELVEVLEVARAAMAEREAEAVGRALRSC